MKTSTPARHYRDDLDTHGCEHVPRPGPFGHGEVRRIEPRQRERLLGETPSGAWRDLCVVDSPYCSCSC